MKWLITGINGFVASHLARYLLDQGEEVIGSYRWNCDKHRIRDIEDKIIMEPADLLDFPSLHRIIDKHRPDYISHLAAQSFVTYSYDVSKSTFEVNAIGTLNLLEVVRMIKEKDGYDPIVHLCSSSEVYGLIDEKDVPITEDCRFNPSNPYACGKVALDVLGKMYFKNYGIKTIRTRMFTHTGHGRTMMSAECAFAKQIARIEKGLQDPVLKHGNLNSVRTWADVRDAVRAYYLLVRKCTPGEVYNIGGNEQHTIGEMLDYLIVCLPQCCVSLCVSQNVSLSVCVSCLV